MKVEFYPFAQETRSHLYMMMKEKPVVFTAAYQTQNEMALFQASVL